MRNTTVFMSEIADGKYDGIFASLYGEAEKIAMQRNRYSKALERFSEYFGEYEEVEIYSAPGRSEVCGNHTDHQRGMVLATSIDLDVIAVVAKTKESVLRVVSQGYDLEEICLEDLTVHKEERGTTRALIRGIAVGFVNKGYSIGGLVAYVCSDVLVGAGLSSSAAFECLLGTIFSGLYNEGKVSPVEIAKIGQFAENTFFGKPCGLMDQMACSVGGMIFIDFKDKDAPIVEKIDNNFEQSGLCLCIVDTKGSHADLTADYAAVPTEMHAVAKAFGKKHLREVPKELFFDRILELTQSVGDRAVLRAIHFYEEEERVQQAVEALKGSDYDVFLDVIESSGNSSAKYLQNIYSPKELNSQKVSVALALTESILGKKGTCRVHGGGFAGTIQVFLPKEEVEQYKKTIEVVYGKGSCHVLRIRGQGGICVLS